MGASVCAACKILFAVPVLVPVRASPVPSVVRGIELGKSFFFLFKIFLSFRSYLFSNYCLCLFQTTLAFIPS